jgi:hypothetical protein
MISSNTVSRVEKYAKKKLYDDGVGGGRINDKHLKKVRKRVSSKRNLSEQVY